MFLNGFSGLAGKGGCLAGPNECFGSVLLWEKQLFLSHTFFVHYLLITTTKEVKNNDLGCVWLGAGVALRVELLERLWCSVVWFGLIIWRQYC